MRKLTVIIAFVVSSFSVHSQGVETIVLAADDASLLAQNYVNPFVKGFMHNLNGGWYTTAKVHQKFGFDFTINPSFSFIPASDENFAFIPSQYNYLSLPNGETSIPTVVGDADVETLVRVSIPYEGGMEKVAEFDMPKGIGKDLPIKAVPLPMVQFGIGLPTSTDLKVRFVPNMNVEGFKFGLFGVGLQHDVLQYFKLDNPICSVSVLAAFTGMNLSYDIENDSSYNNVDVQGGKAEFKVNTWTLQALGSVDLKFISFYGAVGYNQGKATAKMKGDYTLTYDLVDNAGNQTGTMSETISDPFNLSFQTSGMRGTIGTRLNLGFFKIFADYTLQEYNTLTAGIAFSFR